MLRNPSRSGLVLIEMIIAIAFFSVSSAVCISLFVQSHLVSAQTRNLNRAVSAAQSAAECFKAADGDIGAAAGLLSAVGTDGGFTLYYDREWNRTGSEDWSYRLEMEAMSPAPLAQAEISVLKRDGESDEQIFSIEVKKYVT